MANSNDSGNLAAKQQPVRKQFHKDQEVIIDAPHFRGRHGFVRCYDEETGDYGVDVPTTDGYDALGFHWSELTEAYPGQLPLPFEGGA